MPILWTSPVMQRHDHPILLTLALALAGGALAASPSLEPAPGIAPAVAAATASAPLTDLGRSGVFSIQEDVNGRAWFVNPEGNRFFSTGLNDIWPRHEAKAALHDRFAGSLGAWADDALAQVIGLEFNTLGVVRYDANLDRARTLRRAHQRLPFVVAFEPTLVREERGISLDGRPDLFHPRWEGIFREAAQEVASQVADDPLLVGYYLGEDLDLAVYGPRAAWWRALLALPGSSYARDLWADIIRANYDAVEVGAVYGDTRLYRTAARILGEGGRPRPVRPEERAALDALAHALDRSGTVSWADVAATTDVDALELRARVDDRVHRDVEQLVASLAERYHRLAADAIRAVDPSHLLLGGRLPAGHAENLPDGVLSAIARFVDVLSVTLYVDPRTPDALRVRTDLQRIHRLTDRPILVSGWGGFHGQDVGKCHCYVPVPDQDARGACYALGLRLLAGEPYVVGAHFDAYGDRQGVNWGLVDERLLPRADLREAVRSANVDAEWQHAGEAPRQAGRDPDPTRNPT